MPAVLRSDPRPRPQPRRAPANPAPASAATSRHVTNPAPQPRADYRLGAFYALAAAALIALQAPFSALAARNLSSWDFIGFTQVGLLASIPLMLARPAARRDFVVLLTTAAHWPKFLALLLIGLAGLEFYDFGLSTTHPIISAAVMNLSPFWAALVARLVSGKRLPGSAVLFLSCLAVAFAGAMAIAWSQMDADGTRVFSDVLRAAIHSRWILALPMPVFFALSGALVYIWFRRYDEGAAISANFVVSAGVLIPLALIIAWRRGGMDLPAVSVTAILMLLIAVLSSSAAGRLFYQSALSATHNDNGFVTMFFLGIPAISALVSWPLSFWVKTLHFAPNWLFFIGLALVTAPLLLFSFATDKKFYRSNGG